MPKYDFRCTECAKVFEVTRPMTSTAEECCPSCDAAATKVFSPVGVAFKGSGFHNTDYRARPKDESAPAATPCASSGDSPACAGCPSASAD